MTSRRAPTRIRVDVFADSVTTVTERPPQECPRAITSKSSNPLQHSLFIDLPAQRVSSKRGQKLSSKVAENQNPLQLVKQMWLIHIYQAIIEVNSKGTIEVGLGGFVGDIGDWGLEINTRECCTQIDNWPMLTDLSLSCNRQCGMARDSAPPTKNTH